MICLVVEIFLFPERLQDSDAARDEETVGAYDNKDDCHDKGVDGVNGPLRSDRQIVSHSHCQHADKSKKPLCPRLPLPHIAAPQEFHRIGQLYLKKVVEPCQEKDKGKEDPRVEDGGQGDMEAYAHIILQDAQEEKMHQLPEDHASQYPQHQADSPYDQRLYGEHPADVSLPHAQDIVDRDLLLPPPDEKAVCVKQEDEGKKGHHRYGEEEDCGHIPVSDAVIPGQSIHHVVHHDREHGRQHEGNIGLPVVLYIGNRQLCVDPAAHLFSPPVARTVSVSEIFW